MCVFGLFLLNQKRKTGKERERGEREERKGWEEMGNGKTKGNRGNKERKTKEFIIWFKCRGNRNRFWVFITFNDIYLYRTKLLMDIIQK